MNSTFAFEKNGMSVVVLITEDKITCTVVGTEVHQLLNKETGEVSLAAFAKSMAARTYLQQSGKFFSQKIS